MSNLLLSMVDKVGIDQKQHGDSAYPRRFL
jgi:hypothetical protein